MTAGEWIQGRVNPVAVKELRASFRGFRYLLAHMVIVGLCALGMFFFLMVMILEFESSEIRTDVTWIGTQALHAAQGVHVVVLLMVVPAFAATALSTERERQTLDLMLATGLSPHQVVWGKFQSAMVQAGMLYVALVPVVSLCFLFGGVTAYQLGANLLLLGFLASLLVMIALSVSAGSPSTARAVITTYVATGMIGAGLAVLTAILVGEGIGWALLESYGFITAHEVAGEFGRYSLGRIKTLEDLGFGEMITVVYLLPGYLWAVAFSFFYLLAVNRLKPAFANHSTGLRIFYATAVVGLTALIFPASACAFDLDLAVAQGHAVSGAVVVLLVIGSASTFFAMEPAVLPVHLGRAAGRAMKRGFHRWIFHPGARSGVSFVMISNAVALLLILAWWVFLAGGRRFIEFDVLGLGLAAGVVMVWLWFLTGLASLLSGVVTRHPLAPRIGYVMLAGLVMLLPVIHVVVDQSMVERGKPSPEFTPWTAILSPIVAVLTALELMHGSPTFPLLMSGHVFVPVGFCLTMGLLGFALHAASRRWVAGLR